MLTCTICQESLSKDAEYCPCCGANVPVEAQADARGTPSPSGSRPTVSMDSSPPPPRQDGGNAGTATLTVKRGGLLSTDTFTFGGTRPIVIGRFDPETGPVDIDLGPLPEGGYVSRHHANLVCSTAGQWSVRDLQSRNGVFVRRSGQAQFVRVTGEHDIQSGDELALGNARFEFRV